MNETISTHATDPVCGMTVDIERARVAGLVAEQDATTYYFCGRGCMLEFRDNPEKYLDPNFTPSM